MENQVLSIEQMKHLQELGLDTSKASMCWLKMGKNIILAAHDEYCYEWLFIEPIPTFTLQDLLEMLPYKIVASYLHISKKAALGDIWFYVEYSGHVRICDTNLLTVVYDTLCWCIENKYLDKEKTK